VFPGYKSYRRSVYCSRIDGRIRVMKKLLAAILMFGVIASPVFAARKPPKQAHLKFDYRYHTPKYKYKAPKSHQHSHPHNAGQSQSK
jgi:hypothetical protein